MTTVNEVTIQWSELCGKIGGFKANVHNRVCIEREIIPIIFVPGIMGSRLRRYSDKAKIWDPDDTVFMVKKYGWKRVSAAERKSLLIGPYFDSSYAEVDEHDRKHNKKVVSKRDTSRVKRGWGGIMWGSYGSFLEKLQQHQWPAPLSAFFEFPVHAFGYNWTASNHDSGALLNTYIDKITREYRSGVYTAGRNRNCKYVILVTHSMGGLVARSACMIHGAERMVLGVVHGVQPSVGAPAAYWRMKAGFERPRAGANQGCWDWLRNPIKMSQYHFTGHISAVILGTDGEEVTSLLGNSPGGLELLPTKDYRDNAGRAQWLTYRAEHGEVRLPKADPYDEIYLLKDLAYQMVDEKWLDPSCRKKKGKKGPLHLYRDYLTTAKNFHLKLNELPERSFHPQTYQFYGTDLDSTDHIQFTRLSTTNTVTSCHPQQEKHFVNKGIYRTYVNAREQPVNHSSEAVATVTLQRGTAKGDGTVPEASAKFLSLRKGRTIPIGASEESRFDIAHQDIYGTKSAQQVVFTFIRNMVSGYIASKVGTANAIRGK